MTRSSQPEYVRSPFLHSVQDGELVVVWHALLGQPLAVTEETRAFLVSFDQPQALHQAFGGRLSKQERALCELFLRRQLLVPFGSDPRSSAQQVLDGRRPLSVDGQRVEFLELIMTEACNLRCRYCIHFRSQAGQHDRHLTSRALSAELGQQAIDLYFRQLRRHGHRQAVVNFGGGEPLMVWSRLKHFMHYARAAAAPDLDLSFTLNTNLTRLTEEIALGLKKEGVMIATSLDGIGPANDSVRQTITGEGTFDAIVRSLTLLRNVGWPVNGVAVTISKDNWATFDRGLLDWARAMGLTQIRVDPDVLTLVEISPNEIVDRLMNLRRTAATHDILVAGFWSRPFENLTNDGIAESRGFCGAVSGRSMCVAPGGAVYACGYSTRTLGQIDTGVELFSSGRSYETLITERLSGQVERCKGCPIEAACGGGCEVAAECARHAGQAFDSRVCEFYRMATGQLLLDHAQNADLDSNL